MKTRRRYTTLSASRDSRELGKREEGKKEKFQSPTKSRLWNLFPILSLLWSRTHRFVDNNLILGIVTKLELNLPCFDKSPFHISTPYKNSVEACLNKGNMFYQLMKTNCWKINWIYWKTNNIPDQQLPHLSFAYFRRKTGFPLKYNNHS